MEKETKPLIFSGDLVVCSKRVVVDSTKMYV